jgi:hypothetical protein
MEYWQQRLGKVFGECGALTIRRRWIPAAPRGCQAPPVPLLPF